jgi:hypothetical protein
MEYQAEHCWIKDCAEGMVILQHRTAQRQRHKSEMIALGAFIVLAYPSDAAVDWPQRSFVYQYVDVEWLNKHY